MRKYAEYLALQEEANPRRKAQLQKRYDQGWVIGDKAFKNKLAKDFKDMKIAEDWGGAELRQLNEYRWEQLVIAGLKRLKKTEKDIFKDRKLAPWKAKLAVQLRKKTSAGNPWIAGRLNMGHPSNISLCLSQTRKS